MTRRIGILVFDGLTLLDLSGPLEVFHQADPAGRHYDVQILSPAGGTVRASSGLQVAGTVAAEQAARSGGIDTLIVTGGPDLPTGAIDADLVQAAAVLADGPRRVASVCTGAFVLAALGMLDGRRATTHWRHAQTLARRYPRIDVETDVLHLRDGRYCTSAGITAGIDLALALVEEDLGSAAAREVARELVMFLQRPGGQSQFSAALDGPPARPGPLRDLLDAITAAPGGAHTVAGMARSLGVSVRHLNRLFRAEVGTTPGRWLERIRVDAARSLLLDGHPVTRVARLSGLGSDDSLRRAFARHLGTTPTAFRDRFASAGTGHPAAGTAGSVGHREDGLDPVAALALGPVERLVRQP